MRLTLFSINCNDRHYSLGAYGLAAMVRRQMPAVTVRVCNYSPLHTNRHILFDLLAEPADVYGLSVHHGHGPKGMAVLRDLKRLRPEARVLIGGIDSAIQEAAAMEGVVDWCVLGEGELSLVEIMRALEGGATPEATDHVVRPGEVAAAAIGRPSTHHHLDDFPSPYLDGVFTEWERYPTVFLETYRGCVWNCSFCYEGRGRRGTDSYSDERVHEELRYLLEDRRVPQIEFYDTIFNVKPDRTKALLEFLIRHNHGTSFIGEFMLEWLDDETIDLLGRANFSMIEVGLQSTNLAALKASGRKTDLAHFREVAGSVLERTRVNLCVDAMYGLEHDSLDDFRRTVEFIGTLEAPGGRRATPILFVTNVHAGTRLHRTRASGLTLEGTQGGTVLAGPALGLDDTARFYRLFYAYLFLRATFPRTMNDVTGALSRHSGRTLPELYEELASFLLESPTGRMVFERSDWTEFRSNPLLAFFLSSVDRSYLLAFAERLGADAGQQAAITGALRPLLELEAGSGAPPETADR